MASFSERIWALAAPPRSGRPTGSDAELLAQLRSSAPDALTHLVTRHGPAVWRVCGARLANSADVDDAFQATFLALAQSPNAVRNPDCLAAWLNGVAARVCLKLERHRRRHPASSLEGDPVGKLTDPATEAERRELSAAVLDEVARLPDKLRTVILLCSLGGQTSAETAGQLGVPVGTVESRLSNARARLKLRLTRRGIAAAGLALVFADAPASTAECARLLQLLTGPLGARATSQLVISLSTGVTTTMTTLKLMTMTLLVGGALGGIGYGLAEGPGERPPSKGAEQAKKPAAEGAMPAEPTPTPQVAEDATSVRERGTKAEATTRKTLQMPAAKLVTDPLGITHDSLFAQLHGQGIFIRFDYPAIFRQRSLFEGNDAGSILLDPEGKVAEAKVKLAPRPGETLGEYLSTLCVLIHPQLTYRIRGDQVLLTPAYQPVTIAGLTPSEGVLGSGIDPRYFAEISSGPPVSASFDRATLAQALTTLRQQTGANIVISSLYKSDPTCKKQDVTESGQAVDVTATFDDVRLYTVLEVIGADYDLEPVYLRNVFYLAHPERARTLREKFQEEMYGKPTPPTVNVLPGPWLNQLMSGGHLGGIGAGGPLPVPADLVPKPAEPARKPDAKPMQ